MASLAGILTDAAQLPFTKTFLRPVFATIIRSLAMLLDIVFLKKTRPKSLSWETWSTSKCHFVSP